MATMACLAGCEVDEDRMGSPEGRQANPEEQRIRRRTMRRFDVFVSWILTAVALAWGADTRAADRPPNVVVFLCDDLGATDLACFGSPFYETPNLDRLAGEGARFLEAYAACPVCSPTRASLLTGQYPQRTGITDYIAPNGANQPAQWSRNTRMLPAPYRDRLALAERTLAEALHETGYATFFAGKWHLGPEKFYPEDQGFDVNLGGIEQGGPYGGRKYFSPYGNPRLPDGPPGEHLPDRLASETAKFIEAHKAGPFLAYLSFYDVHTPLMARDDLQRKYEEKRRRVSLTDQFGREEPRDVRLNHSHAVYAAMIEAMDQAVGKVLDKLRELNLERETLVIFTSDNGGLSTSEGWPTSNRPLRAGKGWVYEGGIRVPLILRWPGRIGPGSLITTPVISMDLYPTVLSAAAAKRADGQILDGVDLAPLFRNENLPERPLFWHYPHYGNQGSAPAAAVREGPWKLIEWLEDGRTELYQLERDPSETHDMATTEPEIAERLRTQLGEWQKEVGAASPTPNPHYDPAKPDGRRADRIPAAKPRSP